MGKLKIVFGLVLFVLIASCDQRQKQLEKLGDEVMKEHDQAMEKMDQLHNLEMKARKRLETFKDSSEISANKLEGTQDLVYQLVDAQDAMMDWMHQYDAEKASVSNDSAGVYLENQKKRINEVSDSINKAIDEANARLN